MEDKREIYCCCGGTLRLSPSGQALTPQQLANFKQKKYIGRITIKIQKEEDAVKIKKILKEFKEEIEKLYGKRLKAIILYGSWARGEAKDESDIDLLIVLEGKVIPGKEIDRMIDIITEINLKYGALISIYPVSEEDYSTVNSPLLINVRREGTPA